MQEGSFRRHMPESPLPGGLPRPKTELLAVLQSIARCKCRSYIRGAALINAPAA